MSSDEYIKKTLHVFSTYIIYLWRHISSICSCLCLNLGKMMGSVNQRLMHKITDAEWMVSYIESWRDLEAVYTVWDSFIQILLIDTKQRILLPLPFFNASSLLLLFMYFVVVVLYCSHFPFVFVLCFWHCSYYQGKEQRKKNPTYTTEFCTSLS